MKHIKLFESFEDDLFPKGQSPKEEYKPGLNAISKALTDIAVALNNGGQKSVEFGLIVAEIGRLLKENPLKLAQIDESMDKERLQRISQSEAVMNFKQGDMPPGELDKRGWELFDLFLQSMFSNKEAVAEGLRLPVHIVFTITSTLYFVFISLFDDNMFREMQDLFL